MPDFAVNRMSFANAFYASLRAGGYRGPVSFEAFSPTVHQLAEPAMGLRESISFIESNQAVKAA